MVMPRSSYSPPFMRLEPSRGPKEAVLAIGSQAILRAPAAGGDRITLTADDGTTALATVKAGSAVEITAWRPRRSGPALYRVRARKSDKEGWTTASSLERAPVSPSPKASAPVAKRVVAAKTVKPSRGGRRVR
jgi:hypothetical protein